MHYANYLSAREARRCIEDGVDCVTFTPTALKQTNEKTIKLLRENGVTVEEKDTGAGRPRKLSDSDIKKVVAIRSSGTSFHKISNLTRIPKSTVFDYCRRFDGAAPEAGEVRDVSLAEAKKIFTELLKKDLDDEVNDLATRGKKSESLSEIEEILREIEIILYC
jgi:transposase